jgi:hypothetical protein
LAVSALVLAVALRENRVSRQGGKVDHVPSDESLPGEVQQPIKTNRLALTSAILGIAILPLGLLSFFATFVLTYPRGLREGLRFLSVAGQLVLLLPCGAVLMLMVAAPVTGLIALWQIKRRAGNETGGPLAWMGIGIPALVLLVLAALRWA